MQTVQCETGQNFCSHMLSRAQVEVCLLTSPLIIASKYPSGCHATGTILLVCSLERMWFLTRVLCVVCLDDGAAFVVALAVIAKKGLKITRLGLR